MLKTRNIPGILKHEKSKQALKDPATIPSERCMVGGGRTRPVEGCGPKDPRKGGVIFGVHNCLCPHTQKCSTCPKLVMGDSDQSKIALTNTLSPPTTIKGRLQRIKSLKLDLL